MPKQSDIHRLVSLTFDEDPKVRKQAAKQLASVDDPAALFALMELNYDKDAGVKKFAQQVLKEKKSQEEEVMSFAEIFSTREKAGEYKEQGDLANRKERVLAPIRQLFEKRLGKKKAEAVRSKMMPTIEKIYLKATGKTAQKEARGEREVIQEFLTSYLEAISSVETHTPGEAMLQVEEVDTGQAPMEELEEVSRPQEVEKIQEELGHLEAEESLEIQEEAKIEELPDSVFKKAYEIMMLSGGNEKVMRREMRRMVKGLERDVKLAFQLAKHKFKETKITHLTKLKNGMRNVNTEALEVKQVESLEYPKTKKQKSVFTRLVVSDEEGSEAVVYLFDDRGAWIQQNMRVRIVKGHVKTFKFSGETALTIGTKGNVYIVV